MELIETIRAQGHGNVQATHKTTLEVTKCSKLSIKGDCIIAVSADKAVADLSSKFKKSLCKNGSKITISFKTRNVMENVEAFGSPNLILTNVSDLVIRKTNYICNRTLAIRSNKAACDLSRKLVNNLRNPGQKVNIILKVKD